MSLDQFMQAFALFQAHAWMPFAVLVMGYLATTFSDVSKMPINIPDRWKPVAVIVLGQGYAVLLAVQAHVAIPNAIAQGLFTSLVTMGVFDLVIKAVFNGNIPQWAHFLVMFDPNLVSMKAKGATIIAPVFGTNKVASFEKKAA